jgi:hypothetical protein
MSEFVFEREAKLSACDFVQKFARTKFYNANLCRAKTVGTRTQQTLQNEESWCSNFCFLYEVAMISTENNQYEK